MTVGRYQLIREKSDGRRIREHSFPQERIALVYMNTYARNHCYPDECFLVWDSAAHREIARAGSLWHDNADGTNPWPPKPEEIGPAIVSDLHRKITGGKW